MKLIVISLVCLTLATLWFAFVPLDKTDLPQAKDRDIGRLAKINRGEHRTMEVDILGSGYSWETMVDLTFRPGDPFPNLDLDPESFSKRYRAMLEDDTAPGGILDILVKAYVIENGIRDSLAGLDHFFGEGSIKNRIVASLFRFAEASQGDLLKLIPNLVNETEKEYAFSALFSRIPVEGIDPVLFDSFPLPEHAAGSFSDFIVPLVISKKISLGQGVEYMSQAYGREVSDERMTHYRRRLMETDSDEIVRYTLTEVSEGSPIRDLILRFFWTDEIGRSPRVGFNSFLELSTQYPEAIRDQHFTQAMGQFIKTDRREALAWFDEYAASLPDNAKGAVQGALALDSLHKGEFRTAWEQVEQISNPVIRGQFESRIWANELKVVNEQTSQDPQSFVENILTGQSAHAEYWMKQGFQKWHQVNPEEANAWFSQNQDRLKSSQNQHVARAYAEIALGEGNLNLARQWSEEVVDPKFKQKLIEQINAVVEQNEGAQ